MPRSARRHAFVSGRRSSTRSTTPTAPHPVGTHRDAVPALRAVRHRASRRRAPNPRREPSAARRPARRPPAEGRAVARSPRPRRLGSLLHRARRVALRRSPVLEGARSRRTHGTTPRSGRSSATRCARSTARSTRRSGELIERADDATVYVHLTHGMRAHYDGTVLLEPVLWRLDQYASRQFERGLLGRATAIASRSHSASRNGRGAATAAIALRRRAGRIPPLGTAHRRATSRRGSGSAAGGCNPTTRCTARFG